VTVQSARPLVLTLAIVCLIGLPVYGPVEPSARDLFDEIYARGQKLNAHLKTLTASFTETSTSTLLTKPLVQKGLVYVDRPSRVALRYTEPDARVILIDGDRMTVSLPSPPARTVTDIAASQRRIQKYFVDTTPKELRGHFTITAREADDRPNTYLLLMIPKRKQIQEGIVRLDIWMDRTTLMLSAMQMTFPGGETKLMTFADVKQNPPIDPAMFTVK
jgi:outer membrane lipoprotein-sorting protein